MSDVGSYKEVCEKWSYELEVFEQQYLVTEGIGRDARPTPRSKLALSDPREPRTRADIATSRVLPSVKATRRR